MPGLAREAIERWVSSRRSVEPSTEPADPAGVFVTLRRSDLSLRGCIGSVVPTEPTLQRETVRSAVLAATRDPRFAPVELREIPHLRIEVSVLSPAEPVDTPELLDPRRYGVVVRDEVGRRGLLLPDIEGVDTVEHQIAIARAKADIPPGASVTLSRFAVDKWSDG